MDDQLTISTPEQVAFHYEVAGIGSRFVASMLDHLILGAVLILVSWGAGLIYGGISAGGGGEAALNLALALIILIYFLVFWGYFILFEILWNGQTPGKRAGNLRVLRRDGQPIRAGEAIIRNLIRLVDILPGFYGIGLIAMFVDRDARRLGDFAASTLVVREPLQTRLHDVRVAVTRGQRPGVGGQSVGGRTQPVANLYPLSPHSSVPSLHSGQALSPERYDPLPGVSLRDLTPDDYRLAREMIARARRGEMPRERARELAFRLAGGIAARMGHDFREWQARGWDPVVFLEAVLIARDARDG